MGVVNFIENRLVLQGDIKEILIALFGSYQYNQPFEGEIKDRINEKSSGMSVDEYSEQVYSAFEKMFTRTHLQQVFDSRIGRILRIGSEFNTDKIFKNRQIYYNTMFLIAGEYIPSSVILTAIKNQLKNGSQEGYITSFYTVTKPQNSPKLEERYQKGGKLVKNLYTVLNTG